MYVQLEFNNYLKEDVEAKEYFRSAREKNRFRSRQIWCDYGESK